MERSMGWRPARTATRPACTSTSTTLGYGGRHGGDFTYRSADTDVLGWVCERAGGTRMARPRRGLIWEPMGAEHDAEITCDRSGPPCTTVASARSPATWPGSVGCCSTTARSTVTRSCRAAGWWTPRSHPPASGDAFAATEQRARPARRLVPQPVLVRAEARGTALVCLGIHGQMVYVNRATRTVGVKLSSWPTAQDPTYLIDTLRAFGAIGAKLSEGGAGSA